MIKVKPKTKNQKIIEKLRVRIIKAPFVNNEELKSVVLMRSRALVL
ncbi:MAG: hypothetical protein U9Q85_01720 [Patescibacteria group bacterium]|nr:hypothetical protein [Patescibacteria group bacterium]